jgi:hypothetical protein
MRHLGPVVVGVDGSERSVEAWPSRMCSGPRSSAGWSSHMCIPFGGCCVREVAESTFKQIREHLPSLPERRLQLVAESSPAAGLMRWRNEKGRR